MSYAYVDSNTSLYILNIDGVAPRKKVWFIHFQMNALLHQIHCCLHADRIPTESMWNNFLWPDTPMCGTCATAVVTVTAAAAAAMQQANDQPRERDRERI